jgi:hypothetical protein
MQETSMQHTVSILYTYKYNIIKVTNGNSSLALSYISNQIPVKNHVQRVFIYQFIYSIQV